MIRRSQRLREQEEKQNFIEFVLNNYPITLLGVFFPGEDPQETYPWGALELGNTLTSRQKDIRDLAHAIQTLTRIQPRTCEKIMDEIHANMATLGTKGIHRYPFDERVKLPIPLPPFHSLRLECKTGDETTGDEHTLTPRQLVHCLAEASRQTHRRSVQSKIQRATRLFQDFRETYETVIRPGFNRLLNDNRDLLMLLRNKCSPEILHATAYRAYLKDMKNLK